MQIQYKQNANKMQKQLIYDANTIQNTIQKESNNPSIGHRPRAHKRKDQDGQQYDTKCLISYNNFETNAKCKI